MSIGCLRLDNVYLPGQCDHSRARRQSREVCTRSMERVDFDHLCLDLLTSDWSSMCGAGDVTAAYSAFLKILNAAVDIHCPVKRVRFKRRECPWLTLNEELQDLQLQRDSARREWDALRTDASRHRYTALRNKFKTALAKARSEFFSARMSPKDMWKNLRASETAISPNTTKDPDVGLDTETADRFNTYFAGVGQRIATELAEQPVGSVPPRPPIVISAGFRVRPVTISELGDALRRMSNSAAVGCDGVSLKIVRRCFAVLAPHILFLINMSIVSGVVPPEWKQAIVVPIHKSGDKTLPCNFRPVSVLSVIGKLAEKVVSLQLVDYLNANHVMSPTQYAYRAGHSTEGASVDVVGAISDKRDMGQVTCATSCDLSKAFDCVSRDALLMKLEWYGISTHWFRDYFDY